MSIRRLLVLTVFLYAGAPAAHAQQLDFWQRFLPRVHYFEPLVADPMEPRMSLSLMQTNVFERAGEGRERPPFPFPDPEDARRDVNVGAGIGGSIPLLLLKEWPGKGGIVASAQLGVFARFRIEYPSRDDVGQDWFVGMPFEITYDRFTGRFRIMHRSSHLGDEFVQVTGAERIEFGGEYADFLAGYKLLPGVRVYGGGAWNFRSYTKHLPALLVRGLDDTFQLQAGVDAELFSGVEDRTGWTAGFDWQSADRTNWRSQFAFAGGFKARVRGQSTSLLARYYHGPSPMGEFFLTPETHWAIEWVVHF